MGLPSILSTLLHSNQTQSTYNNTAQAHSTHANNAVQNNQAEQMEQGTEQNLERKSEGVMDIDITADTNAIDIKNNFDEFPLDKLPNEVVREVLTYLGRIDLTNTALVNWRFRELSNQALLENDKTSQQYEDAKNTVQYLIDNGSDSEQFPTEETLLAIVRRTIPAKIYMDWAQSIKNTEPLPNNDKTKKIAPAQTHQALTKELFSVLQTQEQGLFKDLLQQGKLSANQWQSWINSIRYNNDVSHDASIQKSPFYFPNKIELFLKTAIQLKDNYPESNAQQNVYDILLAIQHGHLNETQLDQWMRNPSYDLGVISELCQRMSPSLNTEQITADPKAIEALSDLKIKMGPQLHDWLNIAEDNLSLPMAMQAAYASGIDLQKTTLKIREKIIFKKTHVAPVICQLFGHRMWEYL